MTVALTWLTAGGAAAQTFDHGAFDRLLRAHVADGMVDYDAFARAPEFPGYLASLAAADPNVLGRDDRLAFWINAYNAYTIHLINTHQERASIRNINKSFRFVKAYGPWTEKIAVVNGQALGLDHIEQDIIRPTFQEPRIHFALVCAAMGCPPLRREAYVGARLEQQLDEQARLFVRGQPDKNRVDVATGTVHLSPVFIGFRDYIKDFGGTHAAVARYIARYFDDGPEKQLLLSGKFRVRQTDYDWTLNSQDNARRRGGRR